MPHWLLVILAIKMQAQTFCQAVAEEATDREHYESFALTPSWREDGHLDEINIEANLHDQIESMVLPAAFFVSDHYLILNKYYQQTVSLLSDSAIVVHGEKQISVSSVAEALDYLREQAQKGLTLQRYKGLGEMNPDQLWETTMDPENRTLPASDDGGCFGSRQALQQFDG